jgi:hypothetical protein
MQVEIKQVPMSTES